MHTVHATGKCRQYNDTPGDAQSAFILRLNTITQNDNHIKVVMVYMVFYFIPFRFSKASIVGS